MNRQGRLFYQSGYQKIINGQLLLIIIRIGLDIRISNLFDYRRYFALANVLIIEY